MARALAATLALLALAGCGRRSHERAVTTTTASATTSVTPAAPSASAARPARHEPMASPEGYVAVRVHGIVTIHHSDVVLLVDPTGDRAVPIFVGGTEALSIRLRQERQRFQRPLTHDLLDELVKRLGGELAKVHVDDIRGNVFFGRVFVWHGDDLVDVDARPSDAVALALGNGVPIFVSQRVIDLAGMRRSDFEDPERLEPPPRPREPMAL